MHVTCLILQWSEFPFLSLRQLLAPAAIWLPQALLRRLAHACDKGKLNGIALQSPPWPCQNAHVVTVSGCGHCVCPVATLRLS